MISTKDNGGLSRIPAHRCFDSDKKTSQWETIILLYPFRNVDKSMDVSKWWLDGCRSVTGNRYEVLETLETLE